jgi:hypothetical protein
MKVLLIDADSKIPNLALMKLSTYYKTKATVVLLQLRIPYYPRKKKPIRIDTSKYDLVFCSVIFQGNAQYVKGDNIVFGGTGVDLTTVLPKKIENLQPDYHLYPQDNISYGFISRGCIRNCYFCVVPQKEGHIHQVSTLDRIIKHKKVRFLDNNILALPNHKEILRELVQRRTAVSFSSGLDVRLVDEENSVLLEKLNYYSDYAFAFDSFKDRDLIDEKLKILDWRKPWRFKFFVYVNPRMSLSKTIKRLEFLRERQCLPYIMRDISCWDSEYKMFYIDLAAWCNQPEIFKNTSFREFLEKDT